MFNDIVDDTANSCVKLSDSPARLACMVDYIYGGNRYTDRQNVLDCSCVADKYDIPLLQMAVRPVVRQLHLTASNVRPGYLTVAHDSPGLVRLKERCIEYTAKRLAHIIARS